MSEPMRTDFLDYPTAWAIQREVGDTLSHHPKCSASEPNPCFLCDCDAVRNEWERRVKEQAMGRALATEEFFRKLPTGTVTLDMSKPFATDIESENA